MSTVCLTTLAVLVCLSLQVQPGAAGLSDCMCRCECTSPDNPRDCICPCNCLTPKTVCGEGFTKICPEKVGGCPIGDTSICKEDTLEVAEGIYNLLGGVSARRRDLSYYSAEERHEWLEPSNRMRMRERVNQEVKCEGIPKFSCDFIFDYEPYGEVEKFRAAKCTHKKNFKKCKVTIATSEGCEITVHIYNKRGEVYTQGKIRLQCPETTPSPTITTAGTTTSTTPNPYGHAGQGIKVIGDGCQCIPDVALALHGAAYANVRKLDVVEYLPVVRASTDDSSLNLTRNFIIQEIKCFTGIPKFTCKFIFDADEYCDTIINFRARDCTHRMEFSQCPVTLETEQGCKVRTKITTKGKKMLVSPNTNISGGLTRTKGFLENCVCLSAAMVE